MQYRLSHLNIVWTVLLSMLAVLVLPACSDTNNVSGPKPLSPDAQLSSLTVTPETLQPAFSGDVPNYTVDVLTTVTSVTVTATPQDAKASMMVNGQATTSGQAQTITLGGTGSGTPIPIVVTAPNGSQNTNIVTVNRAAPASDNNLSALSVSGQTLSPAFSASELSYTVKVATTVTRVTVSATKSDPNAVMSGSVTAGVGQATGQAPISLNGPGTGTPISIVVTAPNGNPKTYVVIVNREAAANSNNNLSALVVSAGALSPPFNAGTIGYSMAVPNATLTTTVTATVADSTATLTINGSAAISGIAAGPIALSVGANPISIVVTAQDGTLKTYTVTLNRAAIVLSGNNNLSALVVSAGALVPNFDAATPSYNVQAPIFTPDTTVTATVADSTATLTINGSPATSGVASASIPLAQGLNPISIVVTAENGSPKTYTVTVTRIF